MAQLAAMPPFNRVSCSCGNDNDPGIDELPKWQNWVGRETTLGQLRIEDQLENFIEPSASILHIGAGNSGLGRRFAPRVSRILGTTIHHEERLFGKQLAIDNYHVVTANKFSKDMDCIEGNFDFIVDPNPSTYACCVFHFARMMVVYVDLLKRDGGLLLTEQRGLGWAISTNNPKWSLTWDDWSRVGECLRMPTQRLTELVYSMERVPESGVPMLDPHPNRSRVATQRAAVTNTEACRTTSIRKV
jgi:hypothetical protein